MYMIMAVDELLLNALHAAIMVRTDHIYQYNPDSVTRFACPMRHQINDASIENTVTSKFKCQSFKIVSSG